LGKDKAWPDIDAQRGKKSPTSLNPRTRRTGEKPHFFLWPDRKRRKRGEKGSMTSPQERRYPRVTRKLRGGKGGEPIASSREKSSFQLESGPREEKDAHNAEGHLLIE